MLFKSLQSISRVSSGQKNQISSISVGTNQSNNNAALDVNIGIPGLLNIEISTTQ